MQPRPADKSSEKPNFSMDHFPYVSSTAQTEKDRDGLNKSLNSGSGSMDNPPADEMDPEIWSRDQSSNRTAHYNYASEKSLSHVDAKLFYQRHKVESSQRDIEPATALARSRIGPSSFNENAERLSHTISLSSPRDYYGGPLHEKGIEPSMFVENEDAKDLENHQDVSSPGHNKLDTYRLRLDQESLSHHDLSAKQQDAEFHAETEALEMSSSNIDPEMREICNSIKKVIDIRHKHIEISLQGTNDNPKDQANWKVYPPPPDPVWDDVKNRPCDQNLDFNSLTNGKVPSSDRNRKRLRKPGQDIGEDFDLSDFLPLPEEAGDVTFELDAGSIYQVFENRRYVDLDSPMVHVPTLRDFYKDLEFVKDVSSDGPSKSFAFRELEILEGKFNLYFLVNEYEETATCKRVPHRDFYNVRKVDTHVHHSACMNQKHLLRFIKSKMKKSPNEIVLFRGGKELTLDEVFESINLTAYDLSIDTLDMHVGHRLFQSIRLPKILLTTT